MYIYEICVFFVHCNIAATHTQSFPAGFTSRNGLPNREHDPSYQ